MKQILVILRGAPASGKTTIAEKLRDFDKKIVWLKTDNFKPFFSDNSGEALALDAVMEAALNTLNYLLDQGYSVIFEGIFINSLYPQIAIQMGNNKNITTFAYQLECSLQVLKERDKSRKGVREGFRKALGDDEIENLYNKVKENPIENTIMLNTEEKSLEECVGIIKHNFS